MIYASGKSTVNVMDVLARDANIVAKWCHNNGFKSNEKESLLIVCGNFTLLFFRFKVQIRLD